MRTPIIAGNWKMNLTSAEATALVEDLLPLIAPREDVEVVVCPSYTSLAAARAALTDSRVGLGAQDIFWRDKGAYTGQVSGPMLLDAGCRYALMGHSEARGRFGVPEEGFTEEVLRHFGDSDATVNLKVKAALRHGLVPIMCCGETLEERRAGRTDAVVAGQIERGLQGLNTDQVAGLVIAYEPVWAIGTGEVCAADEANRVSGVVRATVRQAFGGAADQVRVQYGGSVKPDNAAELLGQPEIDGALVGGASLKASDFAAIVIAAPSA